MVELGINPVKVAFAEDHTILRQGLVALLDQNIEIDLVFQASNGFELLNFLEKNAVDVVLLDLDMPVLNGFVVLDELNKKKIQAKVIVLSAYSDKFLKTEVLNKGAAAFLTKSTSFKAILNAIRDVHAFGCLRDSITIGTPTFPKNEASDSQTIASDLSKREREVLNWVCKGLSNEEMAKILFISVRTIENHRSRLLAKTSSRNVVELVNFAISRGLVPVEYKR
jgi:DNA-binding NarL/FixJ family response regulator